MATINDVPKPNKRNTISLEIAKDWTTRWRAMESDYNAHNDCRAFNIPLKDLTEVLAEEGVASVRGYIGVEKQIIEGEDVFIEKLIIVGVDANGKDMIKSSDGVTLDEDGGGDIYDFTNPCPEYCDDDSVLNS
ncbi:hypothetical protein [uncultured Polaribacter sp.]|uniref:hypothetical protein n=1 Tax=uncultured Polaribacter sp. TaxID=174711 RepID=UPI0026170F85|nr:hypothetical protein [uncultured Polaribacter sp.]